MITRLLVAAAVLYAVAFAGEAAYWAVTDSVARSLRADCVSAASAPNASLEFKANAASQCAALYR